MTTLLIDYYTTPDEVRAAMGISDEELADETLSLPYLMTLIDEDLRDVSPVLKDTLEPLLVAEDESALSADQQRLLALARLFVTFAAAAHLLDPAELFGFLKVADGRASTERTPDAYTNLRPGILGTLAKVQAKLLAALLVLVPDAPFTPPVGLTFISAVGIAADPVTDV
jgi:hypothetical protein